MIAQTQRLKFSIIIPSYNQGRFIRETVDSVLSQDYTPVELIVMDGGSTDDTTEILKSYGERLSWISEKDRGQAHAINKGLAKVTGDIVAFINSDDYYLPSALVSVSNFFSRNTHSKWVTGDYYIIDENGNRMFSFVLWYKRLLRLFPNAGMLSITNFVAQPSTFWRREIVDDVGYFDENLHFSMDYDYWLRIIKKHPLGVIRNPLSAFRIHGGSKGGSQYRNEFTADLEIVRRYVGNRTILKLHELHNKMIVKIYDVIK